MNEYNETKQNANEHDYGYSHTKDRDPYGTNLARFDSAKHDICNYIHKLQNFFSEAVVPFDDQEKCQILFERIGERDKEKTTYGFERQDFYDWGTVTSKIVRRYPPTNPMRYEEDLRRNTQQAMNLSVADYFGAFKNMYARKQLYDQAHSTPLESEGVDEKKFVLKFVNNCRQHEHLFLLRKINEKVITDIDSLYRVIQEHSGEFLTYHQVAQIKRPETILSNMTSSTDTLRKKAEANTMRQKVEELEKKVQNTETTVSNIARSLQDLSTESKKSREHLTEHLLNFTEEFRKRDSERHQKDSNSQGYNQRGAQGEIHQADSNSQGYDQRGIRGRQQYEQPPHRYSRGYEFRRGRSFDRSPSRGRDRDSWRDRSRSPSYPKSGKEDRDYRSRSRSPGYRTPTTKCSYCTGDPHWKLQCPHASRTEKDRIIKSIRRRKMLQNEEQKDVEEWEQTIRHTSDCPKFPNDQNRVDKHRGTAVQGSGPLICYLCNKRGHHMDLTCTQFCVLCEQEGHGWMQCNVKAEASKARFQAQADAVNYWKKRAKESL